MLSTICPNMLQQALRCQPQPIIPGGRGRGKGRLKDKKGPCKVMYGIVIKHLLLEHCRPLYVAPPFLVPLRNAGQWGGHARPASAAAAVPQLRRASAPAIRRLRTSAGGGAAQQRCVLCDEQDGPHGLWPRRPLAG